MLLRLRPHFEATCGTPATSAAESAQNCCLTEEGDHQSLKLFASFVSGWWYRDGVGGGGLKVLMVVTCLLRGKYFNIMYMVVVDSFTFFYTHDVVTLHLSHLNFEQVGRIVNALFFYNIFFPCRVLPNVALCMRCGRRHVHQYLGKHERRGKSTSLPIHLVEEREIFILRI